MRFLIANAVGGLFLDMGLGKTACVLAALKILKDKGYIKRVLIIAPLRVAHTVWPVESKKWSDFHGLRIEVLHGPKKDEALRRDADIYVINPEGMEWLSVEGRDKVLNADVLIVDESSLFKNTQTQRFKLLKYMLPTFRRRYILTGTPAPNGLLDLFGQVFILDQGGSLGKYITHYRSTYFDPTGYMGYDWKLKEGAEEAIYEKLRPLVLRMEAADYLELPERVDNIVRVELPPAARKVYAELEYQFLTMLQSGEAITAPSAAAVGVKLRQIANGAMYRNAENRDLARTEQEEWVKVHDAKLDALEEIVWGQGGKPVLVAYEFQHDAQRIRKRFKDAVFIGDYSGPKLQAVIDRFNRGEIAMLCAHPASAGHGLNLQGCADTVVWFGCTWNLEHEQQFNARVLRQGNKNACVFIHRIIAADTVDEAVVKAITNKTRVQDALLDSLKGGHEEV